MRCLAILGLLICLVVAGCAQNGKTSDDDHNSRFGGFYGGISGGGGMGP